MVAALSIAGSLEPGGLETPNSTNSVNKLLEILCLTDNMWPSLFFSETLMLLEPRPAAAELCTAQEQGAERQEQEVL